MSVHTFPQRHPTPDYQQARRNAMHAAERATGHSYATHPEPRTVDMSDQARAATPSLWHQIRQEFKAAPAYEQIGLVCFFAFGLVVNIALLSSWL